MKIITIDDGDEEKSAFEAVFSGSDVDWSHYNSTDDAQAGLNAGNFQSADLVLLDVQILDDDTAGVRFAKEVRQKDPALKVIMLSVSNDKDIICRSLRNGATAFFQKPYDGEDLAEAVAALVQVGPQARACPEFLQE